MVESLQSPAQVTYWFVPGQVLFLALHVAGSACFAYIVARRLQPLLRAQSDPRFDQPLRRLRNVAQFWLGQWRHPRYKTAGVLHILIFGGFLILAPRAFALLIRGVWPEFEIPLPEWFGQIYDVVRDYASTLVFLCMVFAAARRIVFRPARYEVPERFRRRGDDGAAHRPLSYNERANKVDAIFLLGMIAALMFADGLFEASKAAAEMQIGQPGEFLAAWSMPWLLRNALAASSLPTLNGLYLGAYFLHEFAFFFLLCYRPFGIQFHVETSLFAIYFAKLDREVLKPVRWGVPDERLGDVKSFGVKTFEDFTWKHVLDFYSCADCGRCAEQCPSNAVGRPLSPRFLTIKARDYAFRRYPVFGRTGLTSHAATNGNGAGLVGTVYSDDEIWSCTTCGACEQECPLLLEYIDKIVDLRRGLVDEGRVPQPLQKPLKALESRGNPYGKVEKKRGDWSKQTDFAKTCAVALAEKDRACTVAAPEVLYFVDSMTSYDDRMQAIARATARILDHLGEKFAILGPAERDSGHEVRRFGEELLFQSLRDANTEAIRASGARQIVTADPHAFNALKHDYKDVPPVEHISQTIARALREGRVRFAANTETGHSPSLQDTDLYAYHDPCYLGRHNGVYDEPRAVLDAIPGLKRVEMKRCRDRSFCCGGGGLMLFYEPKEEQRMGVLRVRMAAEAGANIIVTACPFCLANIEDAIKVAGLEGKMTAIDLAELVDRHLVREAVAQPAAADD